MKQRQPQEGQTIIVNSLPVTKELNVVHSKNSFIVSYELSQHSRGFPNLNALVRHKCFPCTCKHSFEGDLRCDKETASHSPPKVCRGKNVIGRVGIDLFMCKRFLSNFAFYLQTIKKRGWFNWMGSSGLTFADTRRENRILTHVEMPLSRDSLAP